MVHSVAWMDAGAAPEFAYRTRRDNPDTIALREAIFLGILVNYNIYIRRPWVYDVV